jgi:hypothetical protein
MITTRSCGQEGNSGPIVSIEADIYLTMLKKYGNEILWNSEMPHYFSLMCSAKHQGARKYPLSFAYQSRTHKKLYALSSVVFWSGKDSHFRSLLFINHLHQIPGVTTPGIWVHDPYADRNRGQEPSFKRSNADLPVVEYLSTGFPRSTIWIDHHTSGKWFKPTAEYTPHLWFYILVEDEPLPAGKVGCMSQNSAYQLAMEAYTSVRIAISIEYAGDEDEEIVTEFEQPPLSYQHQKTQSHPAPVRPSRSRLSKKQ